MKNLSLETLENYCRTCLQLKRQKINIQSLDLQIRQWLQDATLDNPLATDPYPNSICSSCQKKLKDLLAFQKMCAQSRSKVRNILKTKDTNEDKLKNMFEDNFWTPEEEDQTEESQVENFVRIDVDAGDTFESETIKQELDMKEPMITVVEPADVKNESEINQLDSFKSCTNDVNDDENKKHENSDDENHFINGEENSDSESYFPNDQNSSSLDESSNAVDVKNNKNSKTDKTTATTARIKKYLYKFRCDQCKHKTLSQQTLDIHKRTHLGLKPYQCPKCDAAFDTSTQVLKHLKKIHGEKELNIVCEHENCGKKFKSTGSYKEHYRLKHIEYKEKTDKPEKFEETDDKPVKTTYQHVCEECGKRYASLQAFKEHHYTHGPKELYPFKCTECDKTFAKQRSFKIHQLRHAGIKNFECSFCGAKKTTKRELNIHINSHTRERKFPCPTCAMIFYRPSNLRVHVEVVHQGIRRFACRYCEQTFGKGDNLRMHELLHTGEKPHECKECGRRFVQRVQLRSHMRTHNKHAV